MKNYSNLISLILVFALWLGLLGCGGQDIKKNHTTETPAIVTSMGMGCGSGNTVVHFTYTVNGESLENWTCYGEKQAKDYGFTVNGTAKACYDPTKPKDSSVIPTGYRCGGDGK